MIRAAFWPLDAVCFAWDARRVAGFWRALSFVVREMWRRVGSWLILAPLELAVWVTAFMVAIPLSGFILLWVGLEILGGIP